MYITRVRRGPADEISCPYKLLHAPRNGLFSEGVDVSTHISLFVLTGSELHKNVYVFTQLCTLEAVISQRTCAQG